MILVFNLKELPIGTVQVNPCLQVTKKIRIADICQQMNLNVHVSSRRLTEDWQLISNIVYTCRGNARSFFESEDMIASSAKFVI